MTYIQINKYLKLIPDMKDKEMMRELRVIRLIHSKMIFECLNSKQKKNL